MLVLEPKTRKSWWGYAQRLISDERMHNIDCMPILDDPKHEAYAQLLANPGKMSDADCHEKAGYKRNRGNAARLKANESIQCRIKEIREASAERAEITRASVLELVQDIIDEAREAGQYGPAMTGAVKLGVDIGMFEQKTSNKHYFKPVDQMNEDELTAFLGEQS